MDNFKTTKIYLNSIQILLNDSSQIELVYKDKQIQDISSIGEDHSSSICELTGNPLEASLFIENNDSKIALNSETIYLGFPLKEARKYLNNIRITKAKVELPIWICCEDKNDQNIILLSLNEKDLSRSVVYKKSKIDSKSLNQYLLQFKKNHLSLYDTFEKEMKTSVLCHYDLLEMNNKEDSSVVFDNRNIISLILNWKDFTLEKPTSGIEAELMFNIELNNRNSILSNLYNNLSSLNDQFLIYKEKKYSEQLCKNKNAKTLEEIILILTNEFTSKSLINKDTTKLSFYETLKNIQDSKTSLKKLWTILSECQNLQDLSKAMLFIYEKVQSSSLWIDTSTNNKGVFIKNIKKLIFEPNFKINEILPSQALEMLLEIGIHSLVKDYFTIFQSSDLTFHQSELKLTSTYIDLVPTLGHLHAILEFLINFNNGNINKLSLQRICENILGELRINYPNLQNILQCNLLNLRIKANYLDIQDSIVGMMWKYLRVSLESENKFLKCNSVLLFTEKDIFSNFNSDLFDCTLISEDDMFFTTEMITISEKL